jgi:hypothetical protein
MTSDQGKAATTPKRKRDNNEPNSLFGLIWKILRDWKTLLTVLILAIVIYLGLRFAGYDILPPLLTKLGVSTVHRALDISGRWKYRCTEIGTPFYEWGGTVTAYERATPYGIQWSLYGQRLWESTTDATGKRMTEDLPTPYPWQTNWGVVTAEPAVRYGYIITTSEGTIEGYAYGDIENSTGRADRIIGKFYQLPPYKPSHGRMEFRRMVDASDTKWP